VILEFGRIGFGGHFCSLIVLSFSFFLDIGEELM